MDDETNLMDSAQAQPAPDEGDGERNREPQERAEAVDAEDGDGGEQDAIEEPGKLLRIALMLREMQEEARREATDQAGRDRLRHVHERAIDQLCKTLSGNLRDELAAFTLPFDDGTPSESEILVAQAQLIGWLEGLFQGIQAAIVNQQMQARQQLDQMRQRGLPGGQGPRVLHQGEGTPSTGQYL